MPETEIAELQTMLQQFATDRDWDQFHSPKNLIMALMGEIGELAEIFQWLSPDQEQVLMDDGAKAEHVREELADVFGYVLRLADVLGIDAAAALKQKLDMNNEKYPIAKARGNAKKYTELD